MTREEVVGVLRLMAAAYPNFRPADMTETADAWAAMLEEFDNARVLIAVKKYILSDTSGFAPSIGQVVGMVQDATEDDSLGELEAWHMVSRAISRSGYYAEEEFSKLPPVVQKAVGAPGNLREWALMDSGSVYSVAQSQFLRNYRAAEKRMKEEAKLPPKFRTMLQGIRTEPERLTAKKAEPEGLPEKPEEPEQQRSSPEYIDRLLQEHGFRRLQLPVF